MFRFCVLVAALCCSSMWGSMWASAAQLPLPTTLNQFAFGSCAKERLPQPIWSEVLNTNPQLFLFIGDNQYADVWKWDGKRYQKAPVVDPARFVEAYDMLAAKPGFAKLRETVPLLGTWDDHDYGANDAGKEYPLKAEAQTAFLDFFGFDDDDPIRNQAGIYHSRMVETQGNKVQFVMLDTRYHRDSLTRNPNGRPKGLGPYIPNSDRSTSMLGEDQWQWLAQELKKPADIRFIISSIQVVSYEHSWESWGTMPHERQRLYDLIADTKANGVIFLSGDRHLTEIAVDKGQGGATVPYPIWDFTASGMTDKVRPVDEANQYRVGEPYRGSHFGTITIDWQTEVQDTTITFKAITDKGELIHSQSVTLADLVVR